MSSDLKELMEGVKDILTKTYAKDERLNQLLTVAAETFKITTDTGLLMEAILMYAENQDYDDDIAVAGVISGLIGSSMALEANVQMYAAFKKLSEKSVFMDRKDIELLHEKFESYLEQNAGDESKNRIMLYAEFIKKNSISPSDSLALFARINFALGREIGKESRN